MTQPGPHPLYARLRSFLRASAVVGLLAYALLMTADIVLYNYGDKLPFFSPAEKRLLYRNGVLAAVRQPEYRPWLTGCVSQPGLGPVALTVGDSALACGEARDALPTVTMAAVDGLGFRNDSPPSRAQALFLGDAFCQGEGSGTARSIPALYQQAAGQTVYAACNDGLGLAHYARLLEALTGDGLGPENRFAGKDITVLVQVGDDLTTDIATFRQHQMDELVGHARHLWLESLRTLWAFSTDADSPARPDASAPGCTRVALKGSGPSPRTILFPPLSPSGPDAAWPAPGQEDELRAVFSAMARLARDRTLNVRFVILPTALQVLYPRLDLDSLEKTSPFAKAAPAVVKRRNQLTAFAVSAAEEAGFPVLDMEPLLVGREDAVDLYWPADSHFTPHGNAVVVDAILKAFPAN